MEIDFRGTSTNIGTRTQEEPSRQPQPKFQFDFDIKVNFWSNNFISKVVLLHTILHLQVCLFNVDVFSFLPFFFHLRFLFKFLTFKVVAGVCSYFKFSKVCSLLKITLHHKSNWFIDNNIWWSLISPTK